LEPSAPLSLLTSFREFNPELLPYQDLKPAVLVWHAACIRRGQFPILKDRNGTRAKGHGMGNREQKEGVAYAAGKSRHGS
jgi:hypothetical protein